MNTIGSSGRRAFLSASNKTRKLQRPSVKRREPLIEPNSQSDDTGNNDDECYYYYNDDDDAADDNNVQSKRTLPVYSCEKTLTWINLVSVIVLAIAFAIYVGAGSNTNSTTAIGTQKLVAIPAKSSLHEMPFNLVPNDGKPGRGDQMILSLAHYDFHFDRLLNYRVCCFSQGIFVCHVHGLNKERIGITAYLTHDNTMVLNAHGSEIIGATCKLWWEMNQKDS